MGDSPSKAPAKKAAESTPTKAKAKRVVLSPEEKVAQAEENLRALRVKADEANTKQSEKLTDERAKKVEKRDALSAEIAVLDEQLARLAAQPDPKSPITRANDAANADSGVEPEPADVGKG